MTGPARKSREVRTVRVGDAGWDALARIAVDRAERTGKKVTRSDVAREALREYAVRHDPERQRR